MILLLVAQLLLKQSYAFPTKQQWLTAEKEVDYPDDEQEFVSDILLFGFIIVWVPLCYIILSVWRCLLRSISRRFSRNGIHLMDSEASTGIYDSNDVWGDILDNEEEVRDKVARLSPEEQFYYKQGEEFIKQNPPLLLPYETGSSSNGGDSRESADPIINEQTLQYIEEEGARAWEFQPSSNLPNDFVTVEDKTELIFSNYNSDASVMTNLPIPLINRVYYFECKIFELNDVGSRICDDQSSGMELLSFGLATSPYPYFRLPGRHHHSIAYDSNGARRLNNSFNLSPELATIFPKCEKGDVIGVGYRTRSGTVFFTRNGTKLKEKAVGGHIKGWKFKYLYPIVGANIPCRIHVNFGTYGFVYIEANVKKWGYAKSTGMKLPPPTYEDYDQGILLESAHEDEISDTESSVSFSDILYHDGYLLPPPPGFEFSTTPNSIRDQFTMDSLPVEPPGYFSEGVDNERTAEPRDGETEAPEELNNSTEATKLLFGNTHANTYANQFIEPNKAVTPANFGGNL